MRSTNCSIEGNGAGKVKFGATFVSIGEFMKALISLLIALTALSALAQNRDTDPCYAYRPEELASLPDGVCNEVRGGASSRNDSNQNPARQEAIAQPRNQNRPAVATADIIAVACE